MLAVAASVPGAATTSTTTVAVLLTGEARTFTHPAVHTSQLDFLINPLRRQHACVDVVAVLSTRDNQSAVVELLESNYSVTGLAFLDVANPYAQYQRWAVGLHLLRQTSRSPHDWLVHARPDHYWVAELPPLDQLSGSSIHLAFRCLGDPAFAGQRFTERDLDNGLYKHLQELCSTSTGVGRACPCQKIKGCHPCETRVSDQFAVVPTRWQYVYMSTAKSGTRFIGTCPACLVTQHLASHKAVVRPIAAPVTIVRERKNPGKFARFTGMNDLPGTPLFTDAPTRSSAHHAFHCTSRLEPRGVESQCDKANVTQGHRLPGGGGEVALELAKLRDAHE